jgi:hypothetical protein
VPGERWWPWCRRPIVGAHLFVYRRDPKLARAAQRRFAEITKLAARVRDLPTDDEARVTAFADAWAMATVYQTDAKYEQFLRLKLPDNLDFSVPSSRKYRASRRALDDFFITNLERGHELETEYAKVEQTGSRYWTLAAAARTASIWKYFAFELATTRPPGSVETSAQAKAHCHEFEILAERLAAWAQQGFEHCLERSTKLGHFSEFSRACEAELADLDFERFPPLDELLGDVGHAGSGLQSFGVQADP